MSRHLTRPALIFGPGTPRVERGAWAFGKWDTVSAFKNLAHDSTKPKRTSFWQVDRSSLAVCWVSALPSNGDTCFPAVLEDPGEPRCRIVYNDTSPLDGAELSWVAGQNGETRVVRTSLLLW